VSDLSLDVKWEKALMKRIIDGKSYNTRTAIEVTSTGGDYPSQGWSALYQTRHGAFFYVRVDHDGETVLDFKPFTDEEAYRYMEEHANHLIEQYFGPMPEGGAAERRLTIRVPGNLADRLEAAATAQGLSLNSYAMRCFERCVGPQVN
jgi:predicted HicB family RNase H-like nuclease